MTNQFINRLKQKTFFIYLKSSIDDLAIIVGIDILSIILFTWVGFLLTLIFVPLYMGAFISAYSDFKKELKQPKQLTIDNEWK